MRTNKFSSVWQSTEIKELLDGRNLLTTFDTQPVITKRDIGRKSRCLSQLRGSPSKYCRTVWYTETLEWWVHQIIVTDRLARLQSRGKNWKSEATECSLVVDFRIASTSFAGFLCVRNVFYCSSCPIPNPPHSPPSAFFTPLVPDHPSPRLPSFTFGLLAHKVDRFVPLPTGSLVPICIKIGSFIFN